MTRRLIQQMIGIRKEQFCTMKSFTICLLVCYLCLGEMRQWPRHTICKMKDFEAYYQVCDPLQDGGFSLKPCTGNLHEHINVTLGVILRHDINFLLLRVMAFYNGYKLLSQEIVVCERTLQAYSFCGKKKGDFILYHHPLKVNVPGTVKGHFNISIELINEDNFIVACADFTINIL
ncbi:lymphocyte antigen 86 [Mantella aurantiaca]